MILLRGGLYFSGLFVLHQPLIAGLATSQVQSTGLAEVRQAFGGWSRSVVTAVGR